MEMPQFIQSALQRIPVLGRERPPVIPVVRLTGVIGRGSRFRPGISMDTAPDTLKKAFSIKAAPAVAIIVDSPGGSPVQSHLVHQRIRALAEEHEKTVFVFVEDVCASGGYLIACAGDEIIADPASIIGSIGVISASFGFVDAIGKIGVERRVYTAGENKMILDPFQPEKESDVKHLRTLQDEIHDQFIDLVKDRRGDKLADDPDLFSGLFWTGQSAVGLGLVDATGNLLGVLREKFGEKVRLKLVGTGRGLFARRAFGLSEIGKAFSDTITGDLEERTLRARFGR